MLPIEIIFMIGFPIWGFWYSRRQYNLGFQAGINKVIENVELSSQFMSGLYNDMMRTNAEYSHVFFLLGLIKDKRICVSKDQKEIFVYTDELYNSGTVVTLEEADQIAIETQRQIDLYNSQCNEARDRLLGEMQTVIDKANRNENG